MTRPRSGDGSGTTEGKNQIGGTLRFMSPEQIKGEMGMGRKIDIWAFACVLM